jgi:enoyl-CoA hydratase
MADLVTYELSGQVAQITMDDGKANALSIAMLRALHDAFDRAEKDKAVVVLTGRPGIFSAGFDLKVFAQGVPENVQEMLSLGAELALRVLTFPTPVVTASTGHCYPAGAFLMLAADVRIGVEGPFRIGLNEVTIGLTLPKFAVEISRQRLLPAYFNRLLVTGEMIGPREAITAGFLDQVMEVSQLRSTADAIAQSLTKIDPMAHYATKMRVREPAARAIRTAIDEDIKSDNPRARSAA